MAFDVLEFSRWLGRPEQLFLFQRASLAWRFTTADRAAFVGSDLFVPAAITRSAIREGSQEQRNNLKITLPYLLDPTSAEFPPTQSLGDNWRPFAPSDRISVICYERHAGDSELKTAWMGRVIAPHFTGTSLELTCEASHSNARRRGLPIVWQRGCGVPVYSQGPGRCNLDPELFALPATLEETAGLSLTAAAFNTLSFGSLAGGFLKWTRTDGLVEERSIMAHTGSTIVLNYGGPDLAAGTAVTAYPGCAHNWAACEEFDNTVNYPGARSMPVKNPFGGDPVW